MSATATRTWHALHSLLDTCTMCEHRPPQTGLAVCQQCETALLAERYGPLAALARERTRRPRRRPQPSIDTAEAQRVRLYTLYRIAKRRGDSALATELLARIRGVPA